jgi:Protein of unknown function (DUF732)
MAHLGIRSNLSATTSRGSDHVTAAPRWWERLLRIGLLVASIVLIMFSLVAGLQRAHADSVAYLIEVTVRPGYNFANADAALAYGYQVCDKVSQGRRYADLIGDVKDDFQTGDEFQASYLIDKAVNELCPAQIWQLRQSAAHYRPNPG